MRKHLLNIPFLATLACLVVSAASAQVIIEFSASNYTLGVNGDNEDYIEFYNEGPAEVDLDGHWLSDNPDNPQMFEIPAGTTVPAGTKLFAPARGSPRESLRRRQLEHEFQGDADDKSVVFSIRREHPGVVHLLRRLDADTGGPQLVRDADGSAGQWRVCDPTPGNPNGETSTPSTPTPQFQESGYYAGGTSVAITAPAGYDIRYTTDGYAPTPGSPLYTGPIAVNETTVIRARCFDPTGAYADSHINTNTISPAMTATASS